MPSLLRWMYWGLIPKCNVCKNMTWGRRKSSFALQQHTRSPVAPREHHHNLILVFQVGICHSQRGERKRYKLMSEALVRHKGNKNHTAIKIRWKSFMNSLKHNWFFITNPSLQQCCCARVQDCNSWLDFLLINYQFFFYLTCHFLQLSACKDFIVCTMTAHKGEQISWVYQKIS